MTPNASTTKRRRRGAAAMAFGVALAAPAAADAMPLKDGGGGGVPGPADAGPTTTPAPDRTTPPPADPAPASPRPSTPTPEPTPTATPAPEPEPTRTPESDPPAPAATNDDPPLPLPQTDSAPPAGQDTGDVPGLVGPATDDEPADPAPPVKTDPPKSDWFDHYMDTLTQPAPQKPAGDEPVPGLLPTVDDSAPAPPDPQPDSPKTDPPPAAPPAVGTQPEKPKGWLDTYTDSITKPSDDPPPPQYLSDLMMPGVDLGSEPQDPVTVSEPLPQKPGESWSDYYLRTLTEPGKTVTESKDPPELDPEMDPIDQDEAILSPLLTPFYNDADREAARRRLANDQLVRDGVLSPEDDVNPERDEYRPDHIPVPPPEQQPAPPEDEDMSGMDYVQEGIGLLGFIPAAGAIPDLVNCGIYGIRGKGEDAAWSCGAAVPVVGDVANGVRKGRKVYKVADEAIEGAGDAERLVGGANDVRRTVPATAQSSADDFLKRNPKIDASPESRAAMENIFARTSSGTRANATVPGKFNASHTRGHSSELRTLDDLSKRADVEKITLVPSKPGSRTPDFVVTPTGGGRPYRVEVTTVTGAGRGRVPRGVGRAPTPTEKDISNAIARKAPTGRTSQFESDLEGVDKGGTLAVHLRGGDATKAADQAVAGSSERLSKNGVNTVEIYTTDKRVLRYTRGADGVYRR